MNGTYVWTDGQRLLHIPPTLWRHKKYATTSIAKLLVNVIQYSTVREQNLEHRLRAKPMYMIYTNFLSEKVCLYLMCLPFYIQDFVNLYSEYFVSLNDTFHLWKCTSYSVPRTDFKQADKNYFCKKFMSPNTIQSQHGDVFKGYNS